MYVLAADAVLTDVDAADVLQFLGVDESVPLLQPPVVSTIRDQLSQQLSPDNATTEQQQQQYQNGRGGGGVSPPSLSSSQQRPNYRPVENGQSGSFEPPLPLSSQLEELAVRSQTLSGVIIVIIIIITGDVIGDGKFDRIGICEERLSMMRRN